MAKKKDTENTNKNEEVINSPFAFTKDELYSLCDPKNIKLLEEYGGVNGLFIGLQSSPSFGLSSAETDNFEKHVSKEDCKIKKTASQISVLASNVDDVHDNQFCIRKKVFGENKVPPIKQTSLLELMLSALADKTMIMLCIAACVSLAIGIYQDTTSDDDEPKVHWVEGCAILVAVLIVVLVGSINDYNKEKRFRKLNEKKEDRMVKAFRDGQNTLISVYDVQAGDVLLLEPGDIICADGVLIENQNIRCDESSSTGESDTIKKNLTDDPFIISGSKILEGMGKYIVTGVGTSSFHGRTMMGLRVEQEETPLQAKLNVLAEQIAKAGALAALLMLIVLIAKYIIIIIVTNYCDDDNCSFQKVFAQITNIVIAAITIIVVAVPEGLPLAVTLTLAFAATRMIKDNCLVRLIASCEIMGSATVICSDKTGTLTENKMTVVEAIYGRNVHVAGDTEIRKSSKILSNLYINNPIMQQGVLTGTELLKILLENISINSTAFENVDEETHQIVFIGSKTETALLNFCQKMGGDYMAYRESKYIKQIQTYPFSSERKSMTTLIEINLNAEGIEYSEPIYRVHIKGASEIVLGYCSHAIILPHPKDRQGEVINQEIDEKLLNDFNENVIKKFAENSLRTICLAYRDLTKSEYTELLERLKVDVEKEEKEKKEASEATQKENDDVVEIQIDQENTKKEIDEETLLSHPNALKYLLEKNLVCLAIVGIEDPVREGVPEAIKICQRAGVSVKMVTGDNIDTARSIAKKCGIYTKGGVVMEGSDFRKLSSDEMDSIVGKLQVLARSSPMDKQLLVQHLKDVGETVAVTGDGTNDGPALKRADVGFSMGISGTEVAKEASSIVLMDDNFASIVKAMLWGRSVNDSVKKFIQFQLTVNVSAVLLAFISSVIDGNESGALTAIQLLWVNLIMDTLAALALATESPSIDLLDRPPALRNAPLISIPMWKMIISMAILQVIVGNVLLFLGPKLFKFTELDKVGGIIKTKNNIKDYYNRNKDRIGKPYRKFEDIIEDQKKTIKTMVFNTFVYMQVFNEINCRVITNELNVFKGIHKNPYFYCIFLFVAIAQFFIVQYGGTIFQTIKLSWWQFLVCIGIGVFSLPFAVFIRLIPDKWFYCFFKNQQKVVPKNTEEEDDDLEGSNNSLNSISENKTTLKVFRTVRGGRLISLSSMNGLNGSQKLTYSNSSLNSTSGSKKSLNKNNDENIKKSQNIVIEMPNNEESKPVDIDA
ncbi:calcium-translocating P-type ATPase [Piromyces finnis]|uniref:Calcium-transporting ATPase 2 n=1 Tax=Piromyces finnis TaxID=1754191 RepID=A0A1Y1V066_9FUNG|nr:calcium-translocating P-type ATPase [Piromyces finnis]|eukprot:ORX44296.1 calcium-translocating P-type ATPase [Piromyces finnis]